MEITYEEDIDYYIEREIDSWFNYEYFETITDEITTLLDYVPKDIELKLPDYEKRNQFLNKHHEFTSSDYYQLTQIADQMSGGRTWAEHVGIFDDFFRKHPEYSQLIKDEKAYRKWRIEIPFYYQSMYYQKRYEYEVKNGIRSD